MKKPRRRAEEGRRGGPRRRTEVTEEGRGVREDKE
jgi:hypothetical protein